MLSDRLTVNKAVFMQAEIMRNNVTECCDRHTHTHTHTCWFLWFTGTLHRRNGFCTVQTVCAIALHLPYS